MAVSRPSESGSTVATLDTPLEIIKINLGIINY